ncbi:MobQ family relaxase [Neorhizobium galegae]|uniref:MobQ family relaxase n=1 Tax=Neorhizobium galegae TaxID=399 RepID=UPI001F18B506|nr:MobQ family relaxase [Neorhizobium galegae]UIK04826.1 MobA/MobL family protein [Neorhizobium galegae]
MAIYHFSGQILGRQPKRNPDGTWRPGSKVVAAAAYRSGQRLTDRDTGEVHDYSHRGGVVHEEIMTPPGSALWLEDRELLWSNVEALEIRKDAQLAREFNMALPCELDHAQRLELVRDFVAVHFVRRGMVADLALHDPMPDHGQSTRNFHAHVMLTLRRATPDGLDPVKTREWNSRQLLGVWRAEWAVACNAALERAGKQVRVDHRTLVAQRDEALKQRDMAKAAALDRQPEIHVGPKARQVVRRGRVPVSQVREVNAYRKSPGEEPAARRQRVYTAHDRGSRQSWLETILIGNNERLRHDLKAIDRRFDRISRKLDYWERRASFYSEGTIKGREFRFNRWKAAEESKQQKAEAERRAAHARKRIEQVRFLLKELERFAGGKRRGRESGLVRTREVEGWVRAALARDRGQGRER